MISQLHSPKINHGIADWFVPFLYHNEYKSLAGGRSSGKSYHAAMLAIFRLAQVFTDYDAIKRGQPYYPPGKVRILSGRQFNVALKQSVKVVMESLIQKLGLNDQFQITAYYIKHRSSGSECFFQGIDRNINNILSYDSIDIWWFEQAEFLTPEQMRLILPTARHYSICPVTGKKYVNEKWMVWNPKERTDWTWINCVETPMPGMMHILVNYYDNPVCPENIIELAEYDRINFPEVYDHTWAGQPSDINSDAKVLPYNYIKSCVDAWGQRPQITPNMRTDMGFDVALGGADRCCVAIRTGPIVHDVLSWKGEPDLNVVANRANEEMDRICKQEGVTPNRIYYDGSHPMGGSFRSLKNTKCTHEGVLFYGAVEGKDEYWDGEIQNKDYFNRRNIQLGTALRLRSGRTLNLTKGKEVDKEKCLFINPNIPHIERFLSMMTQPTRRVLSSGRWEIDKRGEEKNAKSPDEFDAMALAFAYDSQYGLRARD